MLPNASNVQCRTGEKFSPVAVFQEKSFEHACKEFSATRWPCAAPEAMRSHAVSVSWELLR